MLPPLFIIFLQFIPYLLTFPYFHLHTAQRECDHSGRHCGITVHRQKNERIIINLDKDRICEKKIQNKG